MPRQFFVVLLNADPPPASLWHPVSSSLVTRPDFFSRRPHRGSAICWCLLKEGPLPQWKLMEVGLFSFFHGGLRFLIHTHLPTHPFVFFHLLSWPCRDQEGHQAGRAVRERLPAHRPRKRCEHSELLPFWAAAWSTEQRWSAAIAQPSGLTCWTCLAKWV